jgi:hypothetical protein
MRGFALGSSGRSTAPNAGHILILVHPLQVGISSDARLFAPTINRTLRPPNRYIGDGLSRNDHLAETSVSATSRSSNPEGVSFCPAPKTLSFPEILSYRMTGTRLPAPINEAKNTPAKHAAPFRRQGD